MIVAENPRFVFVHVFKTGGTSIKRVLRRYAMKPGQEFANFFLKRVGIRQFGPVYYPDHLTANELVDQIGKPGFDSYYSFGFVRNPWDWEVSTYKYILKSTKHLNHETVRSLNGFGEYLRWRCDGRFQLQQDFLYHEGKQLVDFVGRFENLNEDFQAICGKLSVRHQLPALNRTGGAPYQSFYTDELVELVRYTYQSDIDEFGYRFDQTDDSEASHSKAA